MNVYPCLLGNSYGFACRDRRGRWLFVPDFGQPACATQRGVPLEALEFLDPHVARAERERDAESRRRPMFARILGALRGSGPAPGVVGRLLLG